MVIFPLLLAGAEPLTELPQLNGPGIVKQCTQDNEYDLDGRLECIKDQMGGYEVFSILWNADTPEQRQNYQSCYDKDSNAAGSDWDDIRFCLESAVDPKTEAQDSKGGFVVAKAAVACRAGYERHKDIPYPNGRRPAYDEEDCLADHAMGHRLARLARANYVKTGDELMVKAVDDCTETWIVKEKRYDWGMAAFCLRGQMGAYKILQAGEGRW